MSDFDIRDASKLADAWVNGQRNGVIEQISKLSPFAAAYVAVRVVECLDAWGERSHHFTERLFGAATDGEVRS